MFATRVSIRCLVERAQTEAVKLRLREQTETATGWKMRSHLPSSPVQARNAPLSAALNEFAGPLAGHRGGFRRRWSSRAKREAQSEGASYRASIS